jgi:hypothetical protein
VLSAGPSQIEQHHHPLTFDDPVSQEPAARPEGRRPRVIVELPDLEHGTGRGRVDPKDHGDASHIAKQDRRRVAELLTDAVGKNDLIRGYPPKALRAGNPNRHSNAERSFGVRQGNLGSPTPG